MTARPALILIPLTALLGGLGMLAAVRVDLAAPAALRSSPILVTPAGDYVITVNPDSNTLSVVSTSLGRVLAEIAVPPDPQAVSIDPTGRRVYVTHKNADLLTAVDLSTAQVAGVAASGQDPFGVVSGRDGRVYVANGGSNTVQVFDQATLDLLATIPVQAGPRGLALWPDESRLYVTHFLTGKVSVIDLGTLKVAKVISTGSDSNLSQTIVLDPVEQVAYLPQTRSNVSNPALLFDSTVFPVVSTLDLATGENLLRRRMALDILDRPVGLPLDAVLTSSRKLYVLNAGSDDLSVVDLNSRTAVAHLSVGRNPRGIALSPDEETLYVNNTLSGTISVIQARTDKVVDTIVVTRIPLDPDVLEGKILFNTSARRDLANDRWISCATCHFDGGMDGRTWFFRDGPRNTPSLRGVKDTLPMHWSGDLDELQDVEATIRNIQAGSGLAAGPDHCEPACDQAPPNAGRSKGLDDLAAFMRTLDFRRNPNLNRDGSLSDAALRGQAIFDSREAGCAGCHAAPLFTDRARHSVGTGKGLAERKGSSFDTPSLRGIYETAPYLHDGSAATLLEVLTTANAGNLHGGTSHLSARELDDLVRFLESIPAGARRRRP